MKERSPVVFIVDDDIAVLFILEAFHNLAPGDRLVFGLAKEHLLDAGIVRFMKLVEADAFAACRREKLHRERDEPKGEMPFPNRAGHKMPPCALPIEEGRKRSITSICKPGNIFKSICWPGPAPGDSITS